jgi:glycosyltransferase involved in cell wall biosynthesis
MTQPLLDEQAPDARWEPMVAEPQRILLAVHSAKAGGAERMALLEAEYLKHRFELLLAVPEGPLRSSFAAHGELIAATATLPLWGGSARRWSRSSLRTLFDAVRMATLIRRRGIDLVLTNSSVCFAPVLAAKLARVPVVVHARDVPKSRLAPLIFALHGALADTVIVITGGLAPYFRRGRRARVTQIAEGIVASARPPRRSPVTFQSPLRLCLIGGIDPRKGQDIAVEALAQLRERGIEATLALVGREIDGEFADSVRDSAQRLGVARTLEFVGEVDDIGPYLDRADIVIAPSRGEWTPLVLMEALAHCLPVVAARVGGVEDVLSDHESGLLVPPEDPAAIVFAIVELTANPSVAADMARRGQRHVQAHFRIERTLGELRAELDRLLEHHAHSGEVVPIRSKAAELA